MSERSARTTASAPVDMRYPGRWAGYYLTHTRTRHLPSLQAIARFKNPKPCGVASSLESPRFVAEKSVTESVDYEMGPKRVPSE